MFNRNEVFKFDTLFEVEGIKFSCCANNSKNDVVACVLKSGDLFLFKLNPSANPVVRWIPWFDDIKKKIKALSFNDEGNWLLVICADCSLFVLPCSTLLENGLILSETDLNWSQSDATQIPSPLSGALDYNPCSLAWWTRVQAAEPEQREIAIVGSTKGQVTLFALTSSQIIINIKIDDAVAGIAVFDQKPNAGVLLTNEFGAQWRILVSEIQPTQVEVPKSSDGRASRLKGLRQLSVDTIASIRQRITEGRSKTLPTLGDTSQQCSEGETISCASQWHLSITYDKISENVITFHSKKMALTYPANIVVLDNFDTHTNTVHKLPVSMSHLTMTDSLFIFTNLTKNKVFVVSHELSLCKSDPNKQIFTESIGDSILEEFGLKSNETVVSIFCLSCTDNKCVVITNVCVYLFRLKDDPKKLALDNAMSLDTLHLAERLSNIFKLDLQQIITEAANVHVTNGRSFEASQLYSLSKNGTTRNTIMFAVLGKIPDIINSLSSSSSSNKVHLANLKVLAFVHQYLTSYSTDFHSNFTSMINKGGYDEALAVSVLAQAGLCDDLLSMTKQRGLQPVTIVALANILQHNYPLNVLSCSGFWNLMSDYSLCEALLAKPKIAKIHLNFVQENLDSLTKDTLLNLEGLYCPWRISMHPWISKSCQADIPLSLWVQTYLLICIHLSALERTVCLETMKRTWTCLNFPPSKVIPVVKRSIGAGFNHCCVILNGCVSTWGVACSGALGTGPTVARSLAPTILEAFPNIGVKVLSVSCGRNHSLAITDNGIYVWGSNKYGQLGIDSIQMSWFPSLLEWFEGINIVQLVAGQYHSLALDTDGKVYSWGWAVHGQLGHGSVEISRIPKVIDSLIDKGIVMIAAGHAHSLFLDSSGQVWACGSSSFGQLGTGSNTKSSVPIQVFGLPEPIRDLATGYFHSVAVAEGGRVYQWGCSPVVLRATAHAAKRKSRGQENGKPNLDDSMSYLTPTLVDTSHVVETILKVSCGIEHSALVTDNGIVYTWGRNMDGQLGQPPSQKKAQTVPYPLPVEIAANIREIGCGEDYTVALDSTGKIWAWGADHHSPTSRTALAALEGEVVVFKMKSRVIKLPHGTTTSSPLPTIIPVPTQFNELAKKPSHLQENLPTWRHRMHFAIETLDMYYQFGPLLERCISLEECNAASKLTFTHSDHLTSMELLIKVATMDEIEAILDYYTDFNLNMKKPLFPFVERILTVWSCRALPVEPLEQFFNKYFAELSTSVGTALFKVGSEFSQLVNGFSTDFNLRVLQSMLKRGESNLECVLPGVDSINDAIMAIKNYDNYIDINESTAAYDSISNCASPKFPEPHCSSSYNSRKPALYLK